MKFTSKLSNIVENLKLKFVSNFKESEKKAKNVLENKKVVVTVIALISALFIPYLPFTTVTLAYEVNYGGKSLGYIASEDIYKKAETIANESVEGNIKSFFEQPEYNMTIVSGNKLEDAQQLSQKIISNTDKVENAFGLYVGKNCIAISNTKLLLQGSLTFIKNYYIEKTNADVAEFIQPIEIKKCLSVDTEINTQAQINSAVKEFVKVRTGIYSDKTDKLEYKTIKVQDNSMYKGTSKVLASGKTGVVQKKLVTYFVNSEKKNTATLSETIKKQAVAEKIAVGTKKTPDVRIKSGASYAWPLVYRSSEYVSSGFGYRNGRLHKGIDICSDYGATITAAMDGNVVRAGWFESYGYCIEIKHPDGNMTRYAHCSSLLVSVGQTVKMGDVIGKVGSSGRSTGNHLHFEVWENGSLVNPYNYVGR